MNYLVTDWFFQVYAFVATAFVFYSTRSSFDPIGYGSIYATVFQRRLRTAVACLVPLVQLQTNDIYHSLGPYLQ